MFRSLSLPHTRLSALRSISIYNLLLSLGDMTFTHNYITQVIQDALKTEGEEEREEEEWENMDQKKKSPESEYILQAKEAAKEDRENLLL